MTEPFTYTSKNHLTMKDGFRNVSMGEVVEPVVYGVQGKLAEHYGVSDGPPVASTLDHIVAAVGG